MITKDEVTEWMQPIERDVSTAATHFVCEDWARE